MCNVLPTHIDLLSLAAATILRLWTFIPCFTHVHKGFVGRVNRNYGCTASAVVEESPCTEPLALTYTLTSIHKRNTHISTHHQLHHRRRLPLQKIQPFIQQQFYKISLAMRHWFARDFFETSQIEPQSLCQVSLVTVHLVRTQTYPSFPNDSR